MKVGRKQRANNGIIIVEKKGEYDDKYEELVALPIAIAIYLYMHAKEEGRHQRDV